MEMALKVIERYWDEVMACVFVKLLLSSLPDLFHFIDVTVNSIFHRISISSLLFTRRF